MKEHSATVTEEGTCLFVHQVVPENTDKETYHAVNIEQFVNIYSRAFRNR